MNPEVVGRFMADDFRVIPAAGSEGYAEAILDIVRTEQADAFVNACGGRRAGHRGMRTDIEALGTKVLASDPEALDTADNKYTLYSTLAAVDGVDVPEFSSPANLDEFVETAPGHGLSRARGLLQAACLQGVARVPHPVRAFRPPRPAAQSPSPRPGT